MSSSRFRDRLDLAVVSRGLAPTRSRARDLIVRGKVLIGGRPCDRPATPVAPADAITLAADAPAYVSRGAEKLVAALDAFGFNACGRIALDVGASTGGFTQVLLSRGARRVWAVDVGRGQLDPSIATDPRVVAMEATDARTLGVAVIPEPIGAIVADVSFISLTKALPAALDLAASGCWLVALVKPQFEVGPGHVGKGGIVRDPVARDRALADTVAWLSSRPGWRVTGTIPSPILGGSGNAEALLGALRE